MYISDSGALICDCGNQELVLVRCLVPFDDTFIILCRKCMIKGKIKVSADTLITFPQEKNHCSNCHAQGG